MKIVRSNNLEFIPAGHEDSLNPGVLKKVLFKKDDLISGRVQMINWAMLPPGKSFRAHYHEDMEEVFIVVDGKVKIKIDQEEAIIGQGDAVLVPAGGTHKMINESTSNVLYVVVGITQEKDGKTVVVE